MNKLKKRYTELGVVDRLVNNHTRKYKGSIDLVKLSKKELASVAEMSVAPKQDVSGQSGLNSFQMIRLTKAQSPERSKFELSLDVFRQNLPNFVQLSPSAFKDLSSRIQSDIDHEIWDVKYQLTEGMKNYERRQVAMRVSPDGPTFKEAARKRAIEVLDMRKPQIKKKKGIELKGDYKLFAQKFGLKEGLTMKLYDDSVKRVEENLKNQVSESLRSNSPYNIKNITQRENLNQTGNNWKLQRKKSVLSLHKINHLKNDKKESSMKQYMSSGDIYFKNYIEDTAPDQFKGQLQNLQGLISAFHQEEGPESKQLLSKACSVGRSFKKMKDLTRMNIETLTTPQRYYKQFKKLVDKEENQAKAMLIKTKVRRASLNTKILKAIT